MSKRLQSTRAIAGLAVVIVGTMGGASFAAATHSSTSAKATASSEPDVTPSTTPDPAATLAPDPQGYSLYARFERPFATLFENHSRAVGHLADCKDAISPHTCVNRYWSQYGDAFLQAADQFEIVKMPDVLQQYQAATVNATRALGVEWGQLSLDLAKPQFDAVSKQIDKDAAAFDAALDDMDYYLTSMVPSAKTGKELDITMHQAANDLKLAERRALSEVAGGTSGSTSTGSGSDA